ncbi:MAG: SGNH/GDSL hydrolase family protein [Bacteroidales bacterium]|nr:SGNH/GDSL hydrolase family protein [Bacteroidales bacterium]
MPNILLKTRFWLIVTLIGLVFQLIRFYIYGINSVNHLTPFIFYTALWLICIYGIKHIYKNNFKKRQNLILLFTSIFFIIGFAELFLRIFGITAISSEKHFWGHYFSPYTPNQRYWTEKRTIDITLSSPEFSYYRKLNNEGFSDREWNYKQLKNKYRILTLGDSFTEGDGADADSTWQRFLERKLNNTSIFIMNAGICGSDPVFEYYLLTNRLLKYNPHLIIVNINHSDLFDIAIRGGFERFKGNQVIFKKSPWWEPIYAISYISRLFFRLRFDKQLLDKKRKFEYAYESSLIIFDAIKKFVALGKTHHFKFLFVFNPGIEEVKNKLPLWNIHTKKLRQNNIPVCNLLEYYLQIEVSKDISKYYWPIDGHHKAKGYQLMSEGIYQAILQYHLIPSLYEKNN